MLCGICEQEYSIDLIPDLEEVLDLEAIELCPECCMELINTRIQRLEYHLDTLKSAKVDALNSLAKNAPDSIESKPGSPWKC